MTTVQLELPTDILDLPDQTEDSLRALAQEALIVRLYDQSPVTSGWAAHALGLTRRAFLELVGTYGVSEFDEQMDVADEASMRNAPVMSNTGPLMTLAGVGLLDLLPQLYGEIWIPEVVRDEYLAHHEPPHSDIRTLPWFSIHSITTDSTLQAVSDFGAGEAAVISLAQACSARLVIVDDKRARRVARERSLVLVGTLGVLVRARQQGCMEAVRPVLDAMMAQGRHISPALREQTLHAVGESEQEEGEVHHTRPAPMVSGLVLLPAAHLLEAASPSLSTAAHPQRYLRYHERAVSFGVCRSIHASALCCSVIHTGRRRRARSIQRLLT